MQFRTELSVQASPFQLSLRDKFVTLGSCFAENMGTRLEQHKLNTYNNPFGTIYNPLSIFKLICAAICPDEVEEFKFAEREGRWYCYDTHSQFSAESQEDLQQLLNMEIEVLAAKLREAKVLLLTLGTGWVYELNETGQTVANCHKMPAELFTKRLLEAEEIVTGFAEVFSQLKNLNPELQVILTVSPVRHLKDSLTLNQVSKSVLRLATHHLTDMLPDVHYFPAYELQLDDLRDYRFYADDLLHPSQQAVQYIWEKFVRAYFSPEMQSFTAEWEKLSQAIQHRPFHPASASHQAFIQSTIHRLQGISAMFGIDLSSEMEQMQRQLISAAPTPAAKSKTKKARPELVALIQSVANSDLMREEEEPTSISSEFSAEEPVSELPAPVEEILDIDALQDLAEELELKEAEPPVTELLPAVAAEGISKAKKRRNKRKAKKMAAREAASNAVSPTESPDTVSREIVATLVPHESEAQEIKPEAPEETEVKERPVRKPRGKAATRKAASAMNSLLGTLAEVKIAPAPPKPVEATQNLPQPVLPETPLADSAARKPIRKSRAKAKPGQPSLDFTPTVPAPSIDLSVKDKAEVVAETAGVVKEPKPAKEAKKPAAKRTATKKKVVLKKSPAKAPKPSEKA